MAFLGPHESERWGGSDSRLLVFILIQDSNLVVGIDPAKKDATEQSQQVIGSH